MVNIGEDGEIQVKTFSRLTEYKRQKEATEKLFTSDGFLKTGWDLSQIVISLYIQYLKEK